MCFYTRLTSLHIDSKRERERGMLEDNEQKISLVPQRFLRVHIARARISECASET